MALVYPPRQARLQLQCQHCVTASQLFGAFQTTALSFFSCTCESGIMLVGMDRAKKRRHKRRKELRRYHEPGDLHELTFSCYHQLPLLTNDDWRRRLSHHINLACQAESIELVAFVIMPEHVHLLVHPTLPDPDIGRFLGKIKEPFAKEIKEILVAKQSPLLDKLTVKERTGRTCFRFWQAGAGYDRNLYTQKAILASIDYIHQNPVKRGLCARPVDWKWSSARYYLLEPPRQQFPELPFVHGLPMGALD